MKGPKDIPEQWTREDEAAVHQMEGETEEMFARGETEVHFALGLGEKEAVFKKFAPRFPEEL